MKLGKISSDICTFTNSYIHLTDNYNREYFNITLVRIS